MRLQQLGLQRPAIEADGFTLIAREELAHLARFMVPALVAILQYASKEWGYSMQCPVCFDDKARELDSAAGLVEVECQRWLSQVSGGQWRLTGRGLMQAD